MVTVQHPSWKGDIEEMQEHSVLTFSGELFFGKISQITFYMFSVRLFSFQDTSARVIKFSKGNKLEGCLLD